MTRPLPADDLLLGVLGTGPVVPTASEPMAESRLARNAEHLVDPESGGFAEQQQQRPA